MTACPASWIAVRLSCSLDLFTGRLRRSPRIGLAEADDFGFAEIDDFGLGTLAAQTGDIIQGAAQPPRRRVLVGNRVF